MPNDNQTVKSYIEAVLARADTAMPGPWKIVRTSGAMGPCHYIDAGTEREPSLIEAWSEANEAFIAASRQDIPTLAKMLLRAIEALEDIRVNQGKVCGEFELCNHAACQSSCASYMIADATLAEINAMAEGSQ